VTGRVERLRKRNRFVTAEPPERIRIPQMPAHDKVDLLLDQQMGLKHNKLNVLPVREQLQKLPERI
jgi:hypothetical protein